MDRAQTQDQVGTRQAEHPAVGKQTLEDVQSAPVVRLVIGRDQDQAVGNIKIGVAGRQPGAVRILGQDRFRHRQADDRQPASGLVGRGPQPSQVVLQRAIIGVERVVLDRAHDGGRVHKAGDVIHMPVGVIANNACAQPDDGVHPEKGAQGGLNILAVEGRITIRMQQTRLGGQQRAAAVDIN